MRVVEFDLHSHFDVPVAERAIEDASVELGLTTSLKSTLASYKGSIHWHFKRDRNAPGTLEITLFPAKSRIWAKVSSGRDASWIDDIADKMKRNVEARLNKHHSGK